MYQGISQYVRQLAKAFVDLCHMYKEFGEIFSSIGVREPQPEASLTFSRFGEMHRSIEKKGIEMLKSIKIMMGDMNTFISKAVPDTRLTIKKYADVKFEYLVCLLSLHSWSLLSLPVEVSPFSSHFCSISFSRVHGEEGELSGAVTTAKNVEIIAVLLEKEMMQHQIAVLEGM